MCSFQCVFANFCEINVSEIILFPLFIAVWARLFGKHKNAGWGGGGGGTKWPPLNLVISSQMTMKLGKDILWLEIFTN